MNKSAPRMAMDYGGIVIIVGNYGSGKTEIAVNLAAHQKSGGKEVKVVDLDLVNPYFRTREARRQLAALGVEVVLPPEQYMAADLPILSPRVAALIRRPHQLVILDAGGDDVGATVLASLADALENRPARMFQVINPFRPHTDTAAGCSAMRRKIESAAKMTVKGLIGNANLIDDTQPSHIYEGYRFVKAVADESGVPLEFVTVPARLSAAVDPRSFACPVLTIRRQLVPPWRPAEALS